MRRGCEAILRDTAGGRTLAAGIALVSAAGEGSGSAGGGGGGASPGVAGAPGSAAAAGGTVGSVCAAGAAGAGGSVGATSSGGAGGATTDCGGGTGTGGITTGCVVRETGGAAACESVWTTAAAFVVITVEVTEFVWVTSPSSPGLRILIEIVTLQLEQLTAPFRSTIGAGIGSD